MSEVCASIRLISSLEKASTTTYSSYARGCEALLGVYKYLDLVPKGRDEAELPWAMAWVRHDDRYSLSV
jgi:predicted dithiol-disulfide oxidoreductase (DUF899 family)